MTHPRKELVSIDATPYYHIVSRCVRRTFLCGHDKATQTRYGHRRQWLEECIRLVSNYCLITVIAACCGSVRLQKSAALTILTASATPLISRPTHPLLRDNLDLPLH
jgi:hypothetical protein